jgi:hypothetical protein
MARCPAHTVYISTKEKLSLKQHRIIALIGNQRIEVTHRHQIAKLMEEHGWNGRCEITPRDGGSSKTVQLDERIVAGHLPKNAAWWRMSQVKDGASLAEVGGPRQLAEALFHRASRQLGKEAYAALAANRLHDVSVIAAASTSPSGEQLLTDEEIISLLHEIASRPGADLFVGDDPQEWHALSVLLEGVDQASRVKVLRDIITQLPAGITPELAARWAQDDSRALWLVGQADWDIVSAVLQARDGSPLPGFDPVKDLRSRDIVGACERGDSDALAVAAMYPELLERAASAFATHTLNAIDNNERPVYAMRPLFLHHPELASQFAAKGCSSDDQIIRSKWLETLGDLQKHDPTTAAALATAALERGDSKALVSYLYDTAKCSPEVALAAIQAELATGTPKQRQALIQLAISTARMLPPGASPYLTQAAIAEVPVMHSDDVADLIDLFASNTESLNPESLVLLVKAVSQREDARKAIDIGRLYRVSPEAASTAALASLVSSTPHERYRTLLALSQAPISGSLDPALVDSALNAASDVDSEVRIAAARLAGKLAKYDPRFVESIDALLQDPDERVRRGALNAVSELHDHNKEAAGRLLLSVVESGPQRDRNEVVSMVGMYARHDDEMVGSIYRAACASQDPETIAIALERFPGALKPDVALELVSMLATHPDNRVKALAVGSIPEDSSDPAARALVFDQLLADSDPKVRTAAIINLGITPVDPDVVKTVLLDALNGQVNGAVVLSPTAQLDLRTFALHRLDALAAADPVVALEEWSKALHDPALSQIAADATEVLFGVGSISPTTILERAREAGSDVTRKATPHLLNGLATTQPELAFELLEETVSRLGAQHAGIVVLPEAIVSLYALDQARTMAALAASDPSQDGTSLLARVLPVMVRENPELTATALEDCFAANPRAARTALDKASTLATTSPELATLAFDLALSSDDASIRSSIPDALERLVRDREHVAAGVLRSVISSAPELITDDVKEAVEYRVNGAFEHNLHGVERYQDLAEVGAGLGIRVSVDATRRLLDLVDEAPDQWIPTLQATLANRAGTTFRDDIIRKDPAVTQRLYSCITDAGLAVDPELSIRLAGEGCEVENPMIGELITALRAVQSGATARESLSKVSTGEELLGLASLFHYSPDLLSKLDDQPCDVLGKPLVTKVIASRAELKRNGREMGNCTNGYAPALQRGEVMLAFKDASGKPAFNAHLIPSESGWRVGEVNSVNNRGGAATDELRKWITAHIPELPLPTR